MSEEVKQEPELELTDAQKDAVYTIDKNVAVSAGAGSGKTQVLSLRFLFILEKLGLEAFLASPSGDGALQAKAEQIMAVTFTKAAATQMRERIRKAMNKRIAKAEAAIDEDDNAKIVRFWRLQLKSLEKAHIDTKDVNILEEILKKFDKIEKRLYIEKNKRTSYTDPRTNYVIKINFSNIDNSSKIGIKDFEKQLLNMKPVSISIEYCHINGSEMILQIRGYKYELQKYIDDLKFILVDKYEGVKLNIEEYQSNNP